MPAEFKFTPQPFDGTQPEIPAAERKAVTGVFKTGVNDLFANHVEDIIEHPVVDNRLPQYLLLGLTTDKGKLDFSLHRRLDIPTDTYTNHGLTMKQELRRTGHRLDSPEYQYHVDATDVVRRYDANIGKMVSDISRSSKEGTDLENIEEFSAKDILQRIKEEKPNHDLERDMGYQDQPIGLSEVEAVLELAKQAEVPPVSFRELEGDHIMRFQYGPKTIDTPAPSL